MFYISKNKLKAPMVINYYINKVSKNLIDLIIIFIGAMGIFDLYFTLQWIVDNSNMEVNPLMRNLWLINPMLFILFKLSITFIFCLLAFKFKNNKLMKILIWIPFFSYIVVMCLHHKCM